MSNANTPRKKVKEETTYGTPLWLVKAIEEDFQLNFTFDLAADEASCVLRNSDSAWDYKYYDIHDNSLEQDWNNLTGDLWLNPPFANIKAWAAKCETYQNGTICMLVPASLGSSWFRNHCRGRPVYILDTRIMFDGHTDPYPKDLMLVFFMGGEKDFEISGPFSRFSLNSYSVKHAIPKKRDPLFERLKRGMQEAIEHVKGERELKQYTREALQKISELSEEYNLPD